MATKPVSVISFNVIRTIGKGWHVFTEDRRIKLRTAQWHIRNARKLDVLPPVPNTVYTLDVMKEKKNFRSVYTYHVTLLA